MAQPGPAAVPAAVAAGAAPAQPATARAPYKYSEKHASMPDLYGGTYLPFLHAHRPEAVLPPADVLQTALSLHEGLPGVYVYQAHGSLAIRTIHRISKTASIPGVPSQWDAMVFAFEGDVQYPGMINLVQIPTQAFHLTPVVLAPTAVAMTGQWALAGGADCVGPYQAGAPDTTDVTTRRMMPVPQAYVPLLFNRVLTPQEAWIQVGEQIIADGRAADCALFLDWLRAASTYRGAAPAADPVTTLPAPLVVPLSDAALKQQAWAWLVRDLPALDAPAPDTMAGQLVATSAAIRQELSLQRADTAQARQEAKAPKTMSEVYPAIAPGLRRLCHVEDDAELPRFWVLFAALKGKQGQGISALQQLVSARAREPDSAQEDFNVTLNLFLGISQFRLSVDVDNLLDGLSPFLLEPQSCSKDSGTQTQVDNYTMLTSGGNTATLKEIQQLSEAKLKVPENPYELVEFIGAYSVLIDCILGKDQPGATALRHHAKYWKESGVSPLKQVVREQESMGVLMLIMRSVQLTTMSYIREAQRLGYGAALPDYSYIELSIIRRTFQNLSQVPRKYLVTATPTAPVVPSPPMGPAPYQTPPGHPTVLPANLPASPPAAARRTGARVDAPAAQQSSDWHSKFEASTKTVAALKAVETRPSTAQGGNKICLSYHLRGTCFDNCGDKASHRTLVTAENTAMTEFLRTNL